MKIDNQYTSSIDIKDKIEIINIAPVERKEDLYDTLFWIDEWRTITIWKIDDKIISFWSLVWLMDEADEIAELLDLPQENTYLWFDLFTLKSHRWKWYAKQIKKSQISFLREYNFEYLAWMTDSKTLANIYKWYGASISELDASQKKLITDIWHDPMNYSYVYKL